jgi:hypothetical protein
MFTPLRFQVLHITMCGRMLMRGDIMVGFGPELDGKGKCQRGGVC